MAKQRGNDVTKGWKHQKTQQQQQYKEQEKPKHLQ
jgi:hypothetical protein